MFKIVKVTISLLFIILAIAFLYSRSWENALFISLIYKINTKEKVIALTFDDGPSSARTPALLAILEKHNVKATFFMLGENISKYPEIAKQVFKAGHLIGNHSYDHPRMYFKSPQFLEKQILQTDSLIKSLGQIEVKYFRPPYSAKFFVLPLILISMNKNLVTGSYDPPSEYASPYHAQTVANEVINNVKPGSIIYLHDGKESDAKAFAKSVESIIIKLKEKGYFFVKLDDKVEPLYE
ncbi:MAG: polysaccharide deacetylase family protein [Bacteroidota bacterium]